MQKNHYFVTPVLKIRLFLVNIDVCSLQLSRKEQFWCTIKEIFNREGISSNKSYIYFLSTVDANTAGYCIEQGALVPDTLYVVLHMKLGVCKILTFHHLYSRSKSC